ncbi:MAG TPA: hypothetical protein VLM91_18085 [Candidatus Methylomirabilis sp.]|nr:hypothetical protein [Candidatus Methylomirabilis sp.]
MFFRAAAVWFTLLAIAVAAGAVRTTLLQPRIGEHAAHVIGTLAGVAIFAVVIWRTVPWIAPRFDRGQLVRVGIGWVAATVLFEFGFGRYVMGHPWSRLLADYNLLAGRLWVLVLLALLLMPVAAGEFRDRASR